MKNPFRRENRTPKIPARLSRTLHSVPWMAQNEDKIKALLPRTWTHEQNLELLRIGFGFKLLGLDWRTVGELAHTLATLEKAGFMHRQGEFLLQVNPARSLPPVEELPKYGFKPLPNP